LDRAKEHYAIRPSRPRQEARAGDFIEDLTRSCVQDEFILKVKMPIGIGPFSPSILQGERVYVLLNEN